MRKLLYTLCFCCYQIIIMMHFRNINTPIRPSKKGMPQKYTAWMKIADTWKQMKNKHNNSITSPQQPPNLGWCSVVDLGVVFLLTCVKAEGVRIK